MDGGSFIVTKKMPKTVPSYPSKFIDFKQKRVHVYVASKDAVSRTTGQIIYQGRKSENSASWEW
jgi:hypothetical protein